MLNITLIPTVPERDLMSMHGQRDIILLKIMMLTLMPISSLALLDIGTRIVMTTPSL